MQTKSAHVLIYPYAYRVFFTVLVIALLAAVICALLLSISVAGGSDEKFIFQIIIFGVLAYVCYKLFRYMLYIFQWKAVLTAEGIVIYDLYRGELNFNWDYDVIGFDNFNLVLIRGSSAPEATASAAKHTGYKISNWVMGQPKIVEYSLAFIGQKHFKYLELSAKDLAFVLASAQQEYSSFFKSNRWNLTFLAYWFCQVIAIILIGYVFSISVFYFNTAVALFFCVAVTLQLVMVLQYWNKFPLGTLRRLFLNVAVSVIAFAYLLFDDVHFMDELFFLKWGMVLGLAMTLLIWVFIELYRKFVVRYLKSTFYVILFIFMSLYSIAFLKVGNMLDRGKVAGWEQGTVYNPKMIILPGMDPHQMVFDNPQWGARNMLLPLVRSVSEARVEVKVFRGRLGIPWFYKNYAKDDVDNVRLIK